MAGITVSTAWERLKKSFWLLFSTIAVLCLRATPSFVSLMWIVVVFCGVVAVISRNGVQIPETSRGMQRIVSVLVLIIQFTNLYFFKTTWMPSSKVAALADIFGLSASVLLTLVGLVGVTVGFYSLYVLLVWIVAGVKYLLAKPSEQNNGSLVANLQQNWLFPFSALAFYALNAPLSAEYFRGMLIAVGICIVIALRMKSIAAYTKENAISFRIVSFLTAIGICWAEQSIFCANWRDISGVIGMIAAVAAWFFVYFSVLTFWKIIAGIISDNGIFQGITKSEIAVYMLLLISSITFVVIVFSQSEAFYGTELLYDIIYTSDSPWLVKGNTYLSLTHPENDLRQPLFAVFTAPFLGMPYLLGRLFAVSDSVQAMLMNAVQVAMLFTANFLLTRMMHLNPFKRVCFMVLSSVTYTQLLFILMMEQYIVAYFWLILCLYLINEKQQPDRIALWGAGGTLLTSMVLLPLMSRKSPFRDFKAWLSDMVKYGLEFVGVMLVFCRADVIFSLRSQSIHLSSFSGKNITISSKLCQYTHFLTDCFVAPDAGIKTAAFASWQLNVETTVSIAGIGILLAAVFSAYLNRAKSSSLLAIGWAAFSAVILFGLGWGTQENGLILYALYFGWAFLVLLFQLVEWVEDKLHTKLLVPVISLGSVVVFAVMNIPAIVEMVDFAIAYYPA